MSTAADSTASTIHHINQVAESVMKETSDPQKRHDVNAAGDMSCPLSVTGAILGGGSRNVHTMNKLMGKDTTKEKGIEEKLENCEIKAYKGECKNGKRHGKGKAVRFDGVVMKGEWNKGEFCKGKAFYSAGNTYFGERFTKGIVFKGEFKKGKLHKGKVFYCGESFYECEGKWPRCNRGKIRKANAYIYEGEWKWRRFITDITTGMGYYNYRFHGKGKYIKPGEYVYEGGYREGKRHGKGKKVFPKGTVLYGEWKEGIRHGEFVAINSRMGRVYEGTYENGKKIRWVEKYGRGKILAILRESVFRSPTSVFRNCNRPKLRGKVCNSAMQK